MNTESDQTDTDQSDANRGKTYGVVIAVCLAIVAALFFNGLGSPQGTALPTTPLTNQSVPLTNQSVSGLSIPTLPGVTAPSLLGVPPSAQKAGNVLDKAVDVTGTAVNAADTAVQTGSRVIDAGAGLIDGVLGGSSTATSPSQAPQNNP